MFIFLLLTSYSAILITQGYYFLRLKHLKGQVPQTVENKVDEVIETLKKEIPLATTFLRGPLEEKLRCKAKSQVQSLLPEILKTLGSPLSWVIFPYILTTLLVWAISMMRQ